MPTNVDGFEVVESPTFNADGFQIARTNDDGFEIVTEESGPMERLGGKTVNQPIPVDPDPFKEVDRANSDLQTAILSNAAAAAFPEPSAPTNAEILKSVTEPSLAVANDQSLIGERPAAPFKTGAPQVAKRLLDSFFNKPTIPFSKLNVTPQQVQDALGQISSASPELTEEESKTVAEANASPDGLSKAVAGTQQAMTGTLEALTTPFSIVTLGAGALLKGIAARVMSGLFAADMARHTPEQVRSFRQAVDSGDPEAIARTGVGLGLSGAFLYGAAKHATEPNSPAKMAGENLLKVIEDPRNVEQLEAAANELALKSSLPPRPLTGAEIEGRELKLDPVAKIAAENGAPSTAEAVQRSKEILGRTAEIEEPQAGIIAGPKELKGGGQPETQNQKGEGRLSLTPAIVSGEKVFTGTSHREILENAKKAFEAKEVSMDEYADIVQGFADDERHLFTTSDGRILNRAEAGKVFDEMQGNPAGTTAALQSEMLPKVAVTGPNPTVPETPASQKIGIVPEGAQMSMETVGNPGWWSRYFTSQRGLPKGVPEAWLKRMGEVRAETRGATHAARDLANALREEYGISVAQLAKGGLSDVPKPTMDSIQKVLTGQADINTLPERLRESVVKIREHVDELSKQVMERLGADNPLTAKIGENLGIYLTRSYRIFDDPKWIEKIPADVRNQAESFIGRQLQDSGVPLEDVPDMARTKLREMLADWSDNGLDKLMRSGKLGSKDVSLFMQRKDIAPSIRAVMGEYGDPVTNYIRSITKMSRFLGDQEFLNRVKELGMGKWLFEEGGSPAGFEHKLASDESASMSPLNGLRTSEAIKDVFENFNKNKVSDNLVARAYFAINALSKQAKTVFSALTQARNFIGNPFFNIKSGHFNFKDYGKALKTQFADIAGSDKVAQDFYREMAKYGLVDENPIVGELRASIRDAGLQDPSFEDYSMNGAARVLRLAIEAPQRAYRLPDEMGKTVGWLAEQKDLRSAHPDWTDSQIKQEAATRVRNEYPTYSMIPESIQQFRKQPIFGPFVNFAYETVRNGYWALRNGSSDLFTGENAAQRRHGAKKLAGFAAVLASGAALAKIGQQAFNIQKESDDDIRRFLPDYAKSNQLLIYDKDGTKLRYVNYSYLNPYSQLIDPFVAALNNDEPGILNGAAAAFGEFIKPFSNEQMLAGAIKEVIENRDSNDNRIYNPQDDGNVKFQKSAERLLRAIEPGSLERFRRRIWPAMTGEPWPSGDERNLGLEVFSELSGLRAEQKDLTKLFGFKVREFVQEDSRDARKLATSVLFSAKPPSNEEAMSAYQKADDARFRLWQSLYKDYSAVIRQGGEPKEIGKILNDGGLSIIEANKLRRGDYVPLQIDAEDYRNAGRTVPKEIVRSLSDERKLRLGKRLE